MRQIKLLYITIALSILASGCIESYYPKEISNAKDTYVVTGEVTSNPGFHTIKVSKTSSIISPSYIPVSNCQVNIIDSDNNVFSCTSNGENGEYNIWIDEEYLVIGKGFKVNVFTPEGIEIESELSYLKPCPPMGNIYYNRLDKPTTDPQVLEKGIQFKVDLEANDSYDRFFRWEIEETYEYRTFYPLEIYYADSVVYLEEPDYSNYYCWATNPILNIYNLSTKGLNENKFNGFNLHFVNNRSQKLVHLYSILVTQHAIEESYYNYLEQLRLNSSEQGGLFDTQPISFTGNLSSTNYPEIKVLGFFGVSSTKSVRLFFSNIENLEFEEAEICLPSSLDLGLSIFSEEDYPVYLVEVDGMLMKIESVCVNCVEYGGGTTEKPPFWP